MASTSAAATTASDSASDQTYKPAYSDCLPHLSVRSSKLSEAITFYKEAFDADFVTPPRYSFKRKAGQQDDAPRLLLLGRLKFGSAEFLISERPEKEDEEKPVELPDGATITTNVVLHVLTDDVKEAVQKAKDAGAKVLQEPETSGIHFTMLSDPVGFVWAFADTTSVGEEESKEEEELQAEEEPAKAESSEYSGATSA